MKFRVKDLNEKEITNYLTKYKIDLYTTNNNELIFMGTLRGLRGFKVTMYTNYCMLSFNLKGFYHTLCFDTIAIRL